MRNKRIILKVTLKKMKNNKLDPRGLEISFYQSIY